MVIKTAFKILLVGLLLYGGWYTYEFINAWLGVGVIAATIIGVLAYGEKIFKNINN